MNKKFTDLILINPSVPLVKGKKYPFVEMASVSTTNRIPDHIDERMLSGGVRFQAGDTVIARIEPCLQNGKKFYCKDIVEGFGSTEFIVFRPKNGAVDNVFLYYYMQLHNVRERMIQSMTGATGRQRVNPDIFKDIFIDLPSIEVQKKIGCILSKFDDLIENNQKQMILLEETAHRLYKEWFVELRFPGHENVQIVDGVPEGWYEVTLDSIADVIMGQSPKSEYYNHDSEGLPFHQGVGSYGGRFVKDDTYSTSYTRIAEAGSILFSVRAPVGRLNITKNRIVIGRGLSAMNHKEGMQSYLFYLLKERFFKEDMVGNGSIFASISKNELLNQRFLVPDTELVRRYNDMAAALDQKIKSLDSAICFLQEARDRLLPKLMSGEIEV